MKNKRDITQDYVKSRFDYDPESGFLIWKQKTRVDGNTDAWNSKYTDRVAGVRVPGKILISLDGQNYGAHQLVWVWMTGTWASEIDHIDTDPWNNKFSNLRQASHRQNMTNVKVKANSSTQVKGVYHCKSTGRYHANIQAGSDRFFLGSFATIEDAAEAYQQASIKYHGEFGRTA